MISTYYHNHNKIVWNGVVIFLSAKDNSFCNHFKSIIKLWSWWIKQVRLFLSPPPKNFISSYFQLRSRPNNLPLPSTLLFRCHYPPTNIFLFSSIESDGSNILLPTTARSSWKFVDYIEQLIDRHHEWSTT